jgi:hypothetical protein
VAPIHKALIIRARIMTTSQAQPSGPMGQTELRLHGVLRSSHIHHYAKLGLHSAKALAVIIGRP